MACGHGRTGTTSLQTALEMLGLKADHYSKRTMELVHAAEHASPAVDWSLFEEVDAVIDAPIPSVYMELLEAFPKAKFILTVRDPNSWLKSFRSHYNKFAEVEPSSVLPSDAALQLNPVSNTFYASGMSVSPNRMLDFGSNNPSDSQALKRYLQHNMEVQREVPCDRLLVLDIVGGDGWEQLCPFLTLPIPAEAFPHSNKTVAKA